MYKVTIRYDNDMLTSRHFRISEETWREMLQAFTKRKVLFMAGRNNSMCVDFSKVSWMEIEEEKESEDV